MSKLNWHALVLPMLFVLSLACLLAWPGAWLGVTAALAVLLVLALVSVWLLELGESALANIGKKQKKK